MTDELKIYVSRWPGRKNLVMYFIDPLTQKKVTQSAGTADPLEAAKAVGKWQTELRDGTYRPAIRWTWRQAVDEFTDTKQGKPKTEAAYANALNSLQRLCGIGDEARVGTVTTAVLSVWKRKLAESGVTTATIASYLRQVRVFFGWCVDREILAKRPTFKGLFQKQGKKTKAKGRPLTLEEVERMIAALPAVLCQRIGGKGKWRTEPARPEVVASWERLLWGYWHSGLRLQEALALKWDGDEDDLYLVERDGEIMLSFGEGRQKSGEVELTPITPEFETFLRQTPESDRRGHVFKPLSKDGQEVVKHYVAVCKMIGATGKKAKVVVKRYASGKVKYASAHDLRRTFCYRMCRELADPTAAIEFTRHADINTLMDYYVDRNAKRARAQLREARQAVENQHSYQQGLVFSAGPQGFEP